MSQHQYRLIETEEEYNGAKLYQIEALEDMIFTFSCFPKQVIIKKGDKGGYIEHPEVCRGNRVWVNEGSIVTGYCALFNDTFIEGGCIIDGHVTIEDSYIFNSEIFNVSRIAKSFICYLRMSTQGEADIYKSCIMCAEIFGKNNFISNYLGSYLFIIKDTRIKDSSQYSCVVQMPFISKEDKKHEKLSLAVVFDDDWNEVYVHILNKRLVISMSEFFTKFLPKYKNKRKNKKFFYQLLFNMIEEGEF